MFRLSAFLAIVSVLYGEPVPLQTFTLKEYLSHLWRDELVHFRIDTTTSEKNLALTDDAGRVLPCQFTDLRWEASHLTGDVWTVVSLEPGATKTFSLISAPATAGLQ